MKQTLLESVLHLVHKDAGKVKPEEKDVHTNTEPLISFQAVGWWADAELDVWVKKVLEPGAAPRKKKFGPDPPLSKNARLPGALYCT